MHRLWNKYAIILLHIATKNGAFANVDHSPRERADHAKVLTSFLKVPWINLNSSWVEEVTPDCAIDVKVLFQRADAGEMWALQMLDAASKIPAGILTGNIQDLGMYDECVGVKSDQNPANIQGQHCMVSMSMPSKFIDDPATILSVQKFAIGNPGAGVELSFTSSVCLPSSCRVEDVAGLVNASIQGTSQLAEFEIKVVQVFCSTVQPTTNLTLGAILAISFFATIAVLLLFCTACDFLARAQSEDTSAALKTIAQFSVYSNAIKLLDKEVTPGTMPAVNGIRVLSMCICVIGHRIFCSLTGPKVNLSDVYALAQHPLGLKTAQRHPAVAEYPLVSLDYKNGYSLKQSWLVVIALALPYVVDTFFVISGFLMSYWFIKRSRSGEKINIPLLYLHRYLRLTPSLAVLILFSIFILPYLGSGPIWERFLDLSVNFCQKNWWTNLLYVHNFVNRHEMCVPHTWYLAVEMQFFWLGPMILYPLLHRPKLGLFILSLVSHVAFITPAIILMVNQHSTFWNLNKSYAEIYNEFLGSYMATYNRALPYLIGIFLGYDIVNNKRRITKMQAALNWTLTCILILLSIGATRFIQPSVLVYNAVWEAVYVSAARFAWSIAMAWIVYACTQGYGGLLTRFLSQPIFVPLSRLSYSIYLVHFVIQMGTSTTGRVAEFYSLFSVMHIVWGDLVMSGAAAIILSVCVEAPVLNLEKILRKKGSNKMM